jgi:hypothetical protein
MYVSREMISNNYIKDIENNNLMKHRYYTPEILFYLELLNDAITLTSVNKDDRILSRVAAQLYKLDTETRSKVREFILSEVEAVIYR